MKGLIINNLYLMQGSLKVCTLISVALLIGYLIFPNPFIFWGLGLMLTVAIPTSSTSIGDISSSSKWSVFEKKMTPKQGTIVLSRYITYLLLTICGILMFTTIGVILNIFKDYNVFNQLVNMMVGPMGYRTVVDTLTAGWIITSVAFAFYYPLVYYFKHINSTGISFGAIILGMIFISTLELLISLSIGSVVFHYAVYIGILMLLYISSVILSVSIVNSKGI